MKKIYHFNYDYGMAEIKIEVDTNILTTEAAKKILDFYDVFFFCDSRVINTVVKMCAMEVIKAGVLFGNNLSAIKIYIKENNDLDLLDDKSGIKIIDFKPFQFDEKRLEFEDIKTRRDNEMLNLEKELETYFYNKGCGSESIKEAADMQAFLKILLDERLKNLEETAENLMDDIYTLRDSLFSNKESKLSEE